MATHNPDIPTARLAAAALVACATVATLAGCQRDGNRPRVIHGETFPADGQPRQVDRFVHVQSAAAARTDATLNAAHFDGGPDLNSLGRARLDLMLADDNAATPLVVYLDFPRTSGAGSTTDRAAAATTGAAPRDEHADTFESRRESVRAYLADRGLPADAVELRRGPNLGHSHPATDGLRGLKKLSGDAGASAPASNPDAPALGHLMTTSPGQ